MYTNNNPNYRYFSTYFINLLKKGIIPWQKGWQGGFPYYVKLRFPMKGLNKLLGITAMGQHDWKHPIFGTKPVSLLF